MALAGWFNDLPPWATVVPILIGLVVVMTVASMALGVVFAAIAVGVETGSTLVGLLAGTLGIAVIVGPLIAFAWMLTGSESDEAAEGEETDIVDDLREQYVAGKIDEETFERRIEGFLDDDAELDFEGDTRQSDTDAAAREREW